MDSLDQAFPKEQSDSCCRHGTSMDTLGSGCSLTAGYSCFHTRVTSSGSIGVSLRPLTPVAGSPEAVVRKRHVCHTCPLLDRFNDSRGVEGECDLLAHPHDKSSALDVVPPDRESKLSFDLFVVNELNSLPDERSRWNYDTFYVTSNPQRLPPTCSPIVLKMDVVC